MPQPEAKFKAHLKKGFEEFYKDHPSFHFAIVASLMQMAGVPDVYVAAKGQGTVWIEAKANGEKLRKTQQVVIPRMLRAGCRVVLLDAAMAEDKAICLYEFNDSQIPVKHIHFEWECVNNEVFWHAIFTRFFTHV
jgi:hypothetical protein